MNVFGRSVVGVVSGGGEGVSCVVFERVNENLRVGLDSELRATRGVSGPILFIWSQ